MADRLGGLTALASRAPLVLALATASGPGSAAVLRGEQTLSLRRAADARQHAADVIELVDGALADAGCALDAVDAFAVAIGPGSFTRLRVGLATVKGLAFGGHRMVAPVSTLLAMVESARLEVDPGTPLAPALDARRGELYGAVFAWPAEGGDGALPVARLPEGVHRVEDFLARVPDDAVVVGEGASLCAGVVAEGPPELRPEWGAPEADAVGRVGARLWARGEAVEAAGLVPRYLRRAEAERLRRAGPRSAP